MQPIGEFDPNGDPWEEEIEGFDDLVAHEELLEFMGGDLEARNDIDDENPLPPEPDMAAEHNDLLEGMIEALEIAEPVDQESAVARETLDQVAREPMAPMVMEPLQQPQQSQPPKQPRPILSREERVQQVTGRAQQRATQRKARIEARKPQANKSAPPPPMPPQFVALQQEHNALFAGLGGAIREQMIRAEDGGGEAGPAGLPPHVAEEIVMPAGDDGASLNDAFQDFMRAGKEWRAQVAALFRMEANALREDTAILEEIHRHMLRTRG